MMDGVTTASQGANDVGQRVQRLGIQVRVVFIAESVLLVRRNRPLHPHIAGFRVLGSNAVCQKNLTLTHGKTLAVRGRGDPD